MTLTMSVCTLYGIRILRRDGGWCLSGCPADENLGDKPFPIGDMVIDMIAETDQNSDVQIILNEKSG